MTTHVINHADAQSSRDGATVVERLNIARQSSDLSLDPRHRKDADYLTAAGVVAGRRKIGGALMRLHDRKQSSLLKTVDEISILVWGLNRSLNWRLNTKSIELVAQTALAHHIDPTCKHCKGQCYSLIPGSYIKSTDKCVHCDGTGRHPLPRRHRHAIEYLIAELEAADNDTESAVQKVMR